MRAMLVAILGLSLLSAHPSPGGGRPLAVEHWAGNQPRVLRPAKSVSPGVRLRTLDELALVEGEPAALRLAGSTYTLDQEGLYRIREQDSRKVVRQSLLYRGDAWRFAGHLSRLYVYGRRHQAESLERLDERARGGEPIPIQCGYIALFVVQHLSAQGIPARVVNCFTGADWHGYDDGHVLAEIRDPVEERWVLFDATLGARFRHGGRWLNLLEMTQLYRAGGRAEQVEFLNASSKIDPLTEYEAIYGEHIRDKKELAAHVRGFRLLLGNDVESVHRWYARVMQVPLIGNGFVPGSDAEDALLRTMPGFERLERLSPVRFRERYYP